MLNHPAGCGHTLQSQNLEDSGIPENHKRPPCLHSKLQVRQKPKVNYTKTYHDSKWYSTSSDNQIGRVTEESHLSEQSSLLRHSLAIIYSPGSLELTTQATVIAQTEPCRVLGLQMQATKLGLEMFLLSLPSVLLLPPLHCVFETGSHAQVTGWNLLIDQAGVQLVVAPTSAGVQVCLPVLAQQFS